MLAEGIPAFICIIAMPFFYSISEGIAMGVISYVVINLVTGKKRSRTGDGIACRTVYFKVHSDVTAAVCFRAFI